MANNPDELSEEIEEQIYDSSKMCIGSKENILPTKIFEGEDDTEREFRQSHVRFKIPRDHVYSKTSVTHQLSMDIAQAIKLGELEILKAACDKRSKVKDIGKLNWDKLSKNIVGESADIVMIPHEAMQKLRTEDIDKIIDFNERITFAGNSLPIIVSSKRFEFDQIYLLDLDKIRVYQKLSKEMEIDDNFPDYWNKITGSNCPIDIRCGEIDGEVDLFVRTVYDIDVSEGGVTKLKYEENN